MDYNIEDLRKLDRQGREHIIKEKGVEAEEIYCKLLKIDENPSLRNNLATALQIQGKYEEALDELQPNLRDEVINPYSRSLATLLLIELDRKEEAEKQLNQAIKQFDQGVKNPSRYGITDGAWREYTVIIKRAAGALGNHYLVSKLHRKWKRYYQSKEDIFHAGVAMFNRGYPERATTIFERIIDRNWVFLEAYINVATFVAKGLIPTFELEYSLPKLDKEGDTTRESLREKLSAGSMKMMTLSGLLNYEFPEGVAREIIDVLVSLEDWGTSFGNALLESSYFSVDFKMAAALSLIEKGVLEKDQPITMVIDGESRDVLLKTHEFGPTTPEQRQKLDGVQELLADEEYEEALEVLEADFAEGQLPVEGLELLGKLYATLGDGKNAEMIISILRKLPEDFYAENVLDLIISDIYLRLGHYDQVLEHFSEIVIEDLPPSLQDKYDYIEEFLDSL